MSPDSALLEFDERAARRVRLGRYLGGVSHVGKSEECHFPNLQFVSC